MADRGKGVIKNNTNYTIIHPTLLVVMLRRLQWVESNQSMNSQQIKRKILYNTICGKLPQGDLKEEGLRQ
jgi:hypothetical protein